GGGWPQPGGDLDPGRPVWPEYRPGAARPVRLDADAADANRGRESRQDGGAADLSAGSLYLSGDLCRPGWTRCDQYFADVVQTAVTFMGVGGEERVVSSKGRRKSTRQSALTTRQSLTNGENDER